MARLRKHKRDKTYEPPTVTKPDPGAAGQAGDLQGLSTEQEVDSQSVAELLEEGQWVEAAAISGVENAPLADESEVYTREVPEDDVPAEYLEREK